MVIEAIVLVSAGRPQAAQEFLQRMVADEPNNANPYRFLFFANLVNEDYAGYLDALETRLRLRNDAAA